jgi:protein involved in polysaccharide export with SLBB domain
MARKVSKIEFTGQNPKELLNRIKTRMQGWENLVELGAPIVEPSTKRDAEGMVLYQASMKGLFEGGYAITVTILGKVRMQAEERQFLTPDATQYAGGLSSEAQRSIVKLEVTGEKEEVLDTIASRIVDDLEMIKELG